MIHLISKIRGQVVVNVAVVVSVALATIGGWLAQNRIIEAKIDDNVKEIREVNWTQGEDIAALKEAVDTIKDDNTEIKRDIKEILRAVK